MDQGINRTSYKKLVWKTVYRFRDQNSDIRIGLIYGNALLGVEGFLVQR